MISGVIVIAGASIPWSYRHVSGFGQTVAKRRGSRGQLHAARHGLRIVRQMPDDAGGWDAARELGEIYLSAVMSGDGFARAL
jgi:hypothetical protein